MKDFEYDDLYVKLDNDSSLFHDKSCSYGVSGYPEVGEDKINFTDDKEETDLFLNLLDAAFIFDAFLSVFGKSAKDFFNKYIEDSGYRIIKEEKE